MARSCKDGVGKRSRLGIWDRGYDGPRMKHCLARTVLACVVVAAVGPSAWAGPPTDQIRYRVDRIVKVLEDPDLQKESRTLERRSAIRRIADEIFDFTEISQRSLGRHWQARTPAERAEFVALFGGLLSDVYISRIEAYSGERILYVSEAVDGDYVTVRTRIVTKQGPEIPVDYRVFRRDDRWRVFDASIEGVSLVANYRSQFNSVVQRSSYQELVTRLRIKQEESPGARATGRRGDTGQPKPPPSPQPQSP